MEEVIGKHDLPILVAFAAADVNPHGLAVDIADLQMDDLSESQAAGIDCHEQCPVLEVLGSVEDRLHLGSCEDDRQALGPPVAPDARVLPGTSKHLGIEKPDGEESLVDGRCRAMLLVSEE